jgi:putative resolvase
MVQDYQVSEAVVTCSDRLTRFGLDYLTTLFAIYGTKLTILFADEEKTRDLELTEDLLAIMASFTGRLYGLRSRKRKELLSCVSRVLHKP